MFAVYTSSLHEGEKNQIHYPAFKKNKTHACTHTSQFCFCLQCVAWEIFDLNFFFLDELPSEIPVAPKDREYGEGFYTHPTHTSCRAVLRNSKPQPDHVLINHGYSF